MHCSMSRKGSCWDNAPTESFFNSLKNERVHGMRYRTHREAVADLFEYIEVFYNRSRLHSSLGFASPIQSMQNWLAAQPDKGDGCATRGSRDRQGAGVAWIPLQRGRPVGQTCSSGAERGRVQEGLRGCQHTVITLTVTNSSPNRSIKGRSRELTLSEEIRQLKNHLQIAIPH